MGLGRRVGRAAAAAALVVAYGTGVVLAGAPARGPVVGTSSSELLSRLPSEVDPATLPPITVGADVSESNSVLAQPAGMREVLVTLAQNLELENQALLRRDATLLPAVDHGDRLVELRARLQAALTSGTTVVEHYAFASVSAHLLIPFGAQTGASLGMDSIGTVVRDTYDAGGSLVRRESAPFHLVFAVRRALGDRWLIVGVLAP
jgi:hypothetical protein